MENYYMSVRYCTNYTKRDFFQLFQKDHIDYLSDAHRVEKANYHSLLCLVPLQINWDLTSATVDLLSPSSATAKLRMIY